MKHVLSLCFLLCACCPLQAQHEEILCPTDADGNYTEAVVIALSGVKLRAEPGFDAKVISAIPFREKVKLAEPLNLYKAEQRERVYTADSIAGFWIKVRWNGKEGYAFSAFLGTHVHTVKADLYLLFEDAGWCWDDAYADPAYYYYGLFEEPGNNQLFLKKIRPTFYNRWDEVGGQAACADEKEKTVLLLASKTPFAEDGPVRSFPAGQKLGSMDPQNYKAIDFKVPIPGSERTLEVQSSQVDPSNWKRRFLLRDARTGIVQELDMPVTWLDEAVLSWCGDLDRDGVTDFMINCYEKSGYSILFLSRNAGKGRLVRPGIVYIWEDCC